MGAWFKPQNTEIATTTPVVVEQSNVAKQNVVADEISFDVQGLRISNIELKKHQKDSKSDEHITLLKNDDNFIEIGFVSPDTSIPNINTKWIQSADFMKFRTQNFHRWIYYNNI